MKFPKRVKARRNGPVLATIYAPKGSYTHYRVAWSVDGRRLMKHFARYSEAKRHAEQLAKDLAKGSRAAALSPSQANDALAALEKLQTLYRDTGNKISLFVAVSEYAEAITKLRGHSLAQAVEGFLSTVAVVKRKALVEAVAEFAAGRDAKTKPQKEGQRAALNLKYVQNTRNWLNDFAQMFPGYAVSDLTKEHLDANILTFKNLSPKSRNDRRAVVKQFLRWSVAKDYLAPTHRLLEAPELRPEEVIGSKIDFYRPKELRLLLENAEPQMRVVIALQGLAGLRLEEALRLDWEDVFERPGFITVGGHKSKTRQHRLTEIVPALQQWLEPFRGLQGRIVTKWTLPNSYDRAFRLLRESLGIPSRKNGLRHAALTFRYAMTENEHASAAWAGTSSAMLFANYRALATKAEAEKWFGTFPAKQADNIIAITPAAANS